MRWLILLVVLFVPVADSIAQNATRPETQTSACTFEDGKQVSVRYVPEEVSKKGELPFDKLWPSGGAPMYLFTQAELVLNNVEIPAGAYSMFVLPAKDKWTLVINRSVSADGTYAQQQDLVRASMEIGRLTDPSHHVEVAFGHVAPKQCNMRVYYGKIGAWTEFMEK